MLLTVDQLQVGDEVLFSGHNLRYFKILTPPVARTKPIVWHGVYGYKSIKCLEMADKTGGDPKDNRIVYIDFSYKGAWLVEREHTLN
jgi:hypothetical protein